MPSEGLNGSPPAVFFRSRELSTTVHNALSAYLSQGSAGTLRKLPLIYPIEGAARCVVWSRWGCRFGEKVIQCRLVGEPSLRSACEGGSTAVFRSHTTTVVFNSPTWMG